MVKTLHHARPAAVSCRAALVAALVPLQEDITMGDGPGYDYLADQTAKTARNKAARQDERATKLHQILCSCGFGWNDGDLTLVEKEAVRHLELAYELLQVIRTGRSR